MKTSGAALLAMVMLVATACSTGNKAGGASGKEAIVLTFGSQFTSGEPEQLLRFATEVSRKSNGTIRIEFRGNWRARDPHQELDTIRDVRDGKIDLAWVGARAWDWVGVHSFDALVAPFLIDGYPLEQKVFARGIPQQMLTGLRAAGVVGIGVLPGPMRKVFGVHRRLVTAADFRGLAFGVTGIVAAETLHALGARPRQLYSGEPLGGLGGVESQMSSIVGTPQETTARYLSENLNLWPRPLVIFASPKIFRSLSVSQQRVLRQAAAAAIPEAMTASIQEDAAAVHALCASHQLGLVDLTPGQLSGLIRAVAPVYHRLRENSATRRAISQIQALKRATPPAPAIRCTGGSPSAGGLATPIDGTWQLTVTANQLRGNPAYKAYGYNNPQPSDYANDAGTYRFVLHDGHVSGSATGANGTSRDAGTYRIHGHLVTFHISGGHDAGETWTYRWSVYRDTLTFERPAHGAQGPPNPTFAPWRRVQPAPAGSAPTPIEGAWQVTLTQRQLIGNPAYGHPVTAQDVQPDVGTYRLLLRHGRFRASWAESAGVSRDTGTYRLNGNLVTFHITAAHDVGGNDLGETWSYRWSVYRNALVFSRPPANSPKGPPNQMFAPWHRARR